MQRSSRGRSISQPQAASTPQRAAGRESTIRPLTLLRRLKDVEGIEVIGAIVLWKLGTFAIVYLAWSLLPFNVELYQVNYRYGEFVPASFSTALATWDSQHFILLAEQGYQEGLLSNAFQPLYSGSIRALNLLTGDSIVSGLLIANLASGTGIYLLYRMLARRHSRAIALGSALLLMAFPTSFYLNLIYTEALFLLLTVTLFYALYRRNLALAAAAGFLLPLLRLPGLIALVPLVWVLGGDMLRRARLSRTHGGLPRLSDLLAQPSSREALCILAPVAGLALYLVYMHVELGNAFIAMDTERLFISNYSLENLLRPDGMFADLLRSDLDVHNYLNSGLDRAFFAVFAASLPLVYRRVDKPMFLFCLIIGLQPFLGSFMSYTRFVMVAFPLYVAYASCLAARPGLLMALVYPLAMLQALLLALHSQSYWVA